MKFGLKSLQNSVDFEGKTCYNKDWSKGYALPREDVVGEDLWSGLCASSHKYKAQNDDRHAYEHKHIVANCQRHRLVVLILDFVELIFHLADMYFV